MNKLDGIVPKNVEIIDGEAVFETVIMKFDTPNVNGNIYPAALMEPIRDQMSNGKALIGQAYQHVVLSDRTDFYIGDVTLVSFDNNEMLCKVKVVKEFSDRVNHTDLNHVFPCFFAETIDHVVQPGLYLVGFCIEHVDIEEDADNADATEASDNSES